MWPTEENAISRLRSRWARQASAAYTMAITASTPIHGAQVRDASGRTGRAIRTNPYVPIFRRIPARSTEPTVGASVWASGSHVWNGHIGTLMAKPRNKPANATS
jgi:hypothetical protein